MSNPIKYPNDRTNPAGAMPVYLSSNPKAMPIKTLAGPTGANFGPIPVRVVTGPGTPPIGNDQSVNNNAVPVVESTASNAMPIWDVSPAPPAPPIVNQVTFTNNLAGIISVPDVLGVCTCTNGPATWSIINGGGLNLFMSGQSGQLIIMNLTGVNIGTYYATVQATNSNGTDQGQITLIFT